MAAILEQRVTRAAAWSRRIAAFGLVLFLTAALAHRFALLETPAFLIVLAVVAGVALLALLVGAYAFSRFWNHGDLGGGDLTVGLVVALLTLAPFLYAGYLAATTPMLADISTDLPDPPAMTQAERERGPGMNRIDAFSAEEQRLLTEAYPNVTGRRYELPFESVLQAVDSVLSRRGWDVRPDRGDAFDEVTIEARARTFVLGFPADVAIRVTDEGDTTYVDMRSASRYGRLDFGDNAARITAFLDELDMETAALVGVAPPEQPDGDVQRETPPLPE